MLFLENPLNKIFKLAVPKPKQVDGKNILRR